MRPNRKKKKARTTRSKNTEAVVHQAPWTYQRDTAYLYDEHNKGVNCMTIVVLSKYTGRVCIYDGVRISTKRIISESIDVGQGCSEEHREELKIAEFCNTPGRKLQRPCEE